MITPELKDSGVNAADGERSKYISAECEIFAQASPKGDQISPDVKRFWNQN